jgi:hypothetical protein
MVEIGKSTDPEPKTWTLEEVARAFGQLPEGLVRAVSYAYVSSLCSFLQLTMPIRTRRLVPMLDAAQTVDMRWVGNPHTPFRTCTIAFA